MCSCVTCSLWLCLSREVGLDNVQRSLPTLTALGFCDSQSKADRPAEKSHWKINYLVHLQIKPGVLALISLLFSNKGAKKLFCLWGHCWCTEITHSAGRLEGAARAGAAIPAGSSLVNSLAGKSIRKLKMLSNKAGNSLCCTQQIMGVFIHPRWAFSNKIEKVITCPLEGNFQKLEGSGHGLCSNFRLF